MSMRWQPVSFNEIRREMCDHWATLPSRVDSFLEDHILASHHHRLAVDGDPAAIASVHEEGLLTQFVVADPFKPQGQAIFRRARRLASVRAALVPTCDEFYLSHALDEYRTLAKQAYFFSAPAMLPPHPPSSCTLVPATEGDLALIERESGDFFQNAAQSIEAQQLYLVRERDEAIAFGLTVPSTLYDSVASIGMFTIERFRQRGIGSATIRLLIAACRERGWEPVAGCWYYNHLSKRTLERAGMVTQTRLLRVEW